MPGLVTQVKGFIEDLFDTGIEGIDETLIDEEPIEEEPATTINRKNISAVRPLNTHGYEVVVIEPTTFNDSLELFESIMDKMGTHLKCSYPQLLLPDLNCLGNSLIRLIIQQEQKHCKGRNTGSQNYKKNPV